MPGPNPTQEQKGDLKRRFGVMLWLWPLYPPPLQGTSLMFWGASLAPTWLLSHQVGAVAKRTFLSLIRRPRGLPYGGRKDFGEKIFRLEIFSWLKISELSQDYFLTVVSCRFSEFLVERDLFIITSNSSTDHARTGADSEVIFEKLQHLWRGPQPLQHS